MIVKHRPFDPALDPKRATIKYRHLVLGRRVLFHETQRVVRPFMASAGLPEQGVEPVKSIVASLAWSKRQCSRDFLRRGRIVPDAAVRPKLQLLEIACRRGATSPGRSSADPHCAGTADGRPNRSLSAFQPSVRGKVICSRIDMRRPPSIPSSSASPSTQVPKMRSMKMKLPA